MVGKEVVAEVALDEVGDGLGEGEHVGGESGEEVESSEGGFPETCCGWGVHDDELLIAEIYSLE